MSVLALNEIQQKVYDLLNANEDFTGTVGIDDGTVLVAREAMLNNVSYGAFATVLPLLDADTVGTAPGSSLLRVTVAVRYEVNRGVEGGITIDLYGTVKSLIQTVTAYSNTNKSDRFTLAPKAFVIADSDPGLDAVIIFFDKYATIA